MNAVNYGCTNAMRIPPTTGTGKACPLVGPQPAESNLSTFSRVQTHAFQSVRPPGNKTRAIGAIGGARSCRRHLQGLSIPARTQVTHAEVDT